jgi:hypothetical protein
MQITLATCLARVFPRPRENRKQDSREQRDYGHDNKQFNQRERFKSTFINTT